MSDVSIYSISSHDHFEIAFYLFKGYLIGNVHVIPKNGGQLCQFSITGDEALKELQFEFYNGDPLVSLSSYRQMLNKVKSVTGAALKEYRKGGKA